MRCKYPSVGSKAAAVLTGVMRVPGYPEDSPKTQFHSAKNKKLHLNLIFRPSKRVAACRRCHVTAPSIPPSQAYPVGQTPGWCLDHETKFQANWLMNVNHIQVKNTSLASCGATNLSRFHYRVIVTLTVDPDVQQN